MVGGAHGLGRYHERSRIGHAITGRDDETTWFGTPPKASTSSRSAADVQDVDFSDTTPGTFPFIGGPRPTMYAGQPWTIRQYAGFSTIREARRVLAELG